MIKYIRINWIIFKNSYIRDLKIPGMITSRITFYLVDIALSILFFKVIFANTQTLAGWNFYQVLFLYAFAKIIISIHSGWTKNGLARFSSEMVRRGDYDFFLIKPVNPMFLVSISRPHLYNFIGVLFEINLALYALIIGHISVGFGNLIWFFVLAGFGLVLYYFLLVLTAVPAFWFVRLWSLQDVMGRLNQVMRYPAGVFPPFIRAIFMTAFPIIAISYLPVQTLFNGPKIEYIMGILALTVFFGYLTNFIWQLGQKHYSSASS